MEGEFKDLDFLGVVLAGLKVALQVGPWGAHSWAGVDASDAKAGDLLWENLALLRAFKCWDKIHLDQKIIYPHLHCNDCIRVD